MNNWKELNEIVNNYKLQLQEIRKLIEIEFKNGNCENLESEITAINPILVIRDNEFNLLAEIEISNSPIESEPVIIARRFAGEDFENCEISGNLDRAIRTARKNAFTLLFILG